MLHELEELIVEQYRIIDFLGVGLGGETYKAIDLKNEQFVVLKVLSLQLWKPKMLVAVASNKMKNDRSMLFYFLVLMGFDAIFKTVINNYIRVWNSFQILG